MTEEHPTIEFSFDNGTPTIVNTGDTPVLIRGLAAGTALLAPGQGVELWFVTDETEQS